MSPASRTVAVCLSLFLAGAACSVPIERQTSSGGGSLVIGLPQIGNLDPPRAQGSSALTVLGTACDGLLGLDPETSAPRPALAESWSLKEGARSLTVRLRPELTFHDGTAVTAAAVREALSRVARPATSSPWSELVSKVEGYGEVLAGNATHLSGIRAVDELNLEVELSEPYSDFVTVLSHPALLPVSLESLKESPDGRTEPVCAGPYRIDKGLDEGDLRLTRSTGSVSRNDAYLSRGRGAAERILVRSFDSPEDAYQAYRSGTVDMAGIPDSRLAEAQASGRGYVSGPTPEILYLAFDPANPATDDPRFRQALSLAIDRLVIIDAAYGDQRQPATRWLPGDYGSGVESSCSSFARRIADPVRAKELLRASDVDPESLELSLFYDPSVTGRMVAEALELQVRDAIGVELNPDPLEGQDAAASFRDRGSEPGLWVLSTDIQLPLADQFLGELFRTGADRNLLQFSDRTFDARIEEARKATARGDIERLYVQAESALCNQMPAIPLWSSVSHWMVNPDKVRFEGDLKLDALGTPLLRHARVTG